MNRDLKTTEMPWAGLSQHDKDLLEEVGKENLVMWDDGEWKCQKGSSVGWLTSFTYLIKRKYLMKGLT